MKYLFSLLVMCLSVTLFSQDVTIEGYIYETGNRGYINGVDITAENIDTDMMITKGLTDESGLFVIKVPQNTNVRIYAAKDMFDVKKIDVEVKTKKVFLKLEMGRSPGYTFEVTLAEKRTDENQVVDAIKGARIEIYNNTKRESVMDLKEHMNPEFQLNLEKGNHYTILVRKEGYLSKRMEAKVDVEGCILCFEGVGNVNPGVSDNLTEGNAFGVLLANVELERIFEGKKMEIQNLYYDTNKWKVTPQAKSELNKVITLMKDNPNLTVELGSHTDSRGKDEGNLALSQKRAKSAVEYLINKGEIAKARIVSRGYGEMILLNECADGVKCSDEQHAKNRRTELKIVGITNTAQIKSLKKMKEEEHMEEEILKLMDQEPIEVKGEEELKKIIEAEKKAKMNEGTEETYQQRIDRERAELKTKQKAPKKPSATMSTGVKELPTAVEAPPSKDPMKIMDDMPGLEVIDPRLDNMKGYKVVIFEGTMPLPKTHDMFKKHEEIQFYKSENSRYLYMIPFASKDGAQIFFDSFAQHDYRGSYIASFVNGKLTKI